MLIYLITNKVNRKVYVGQTRQRDPRRRWAAHVCKAKSGFPTALYAAIRKYGAENFELSVLQRYATAEELTSAEIGFIKYYQATHRSHGYNMTEGGEGASHSEESRRKMSESHKGLSHVVSSDHKSKMSMLMKGKRNCLGNIPSEETKRRIRLALSGRKFSAEHRVKLSLAAKLRCARSKRTEKKEEEG